MLVLGDVLQETKESMDEYLKSTRKSSEREDVGLVQFHLSQRTNQYLESDARAKRDPYVVLTGTGRVAHVYLETERSTVVQFD